MTGFGKGGRGQILYVHEAIGLGALASNTVIEIKVYTLEEDFRILKMEGYIGRSDRQSGDDSAVIFVLYDSTLTIAQVAECLASEPKNSNEIVPLERSHRPVFILGSPETGNGGYEGTTVGQQGHLIPFEWDQRWTFANPEGFAFGVFNAFGGALPTGSQALLFAKIYGVWVK